MLSAGILFISFAVFRIAGGTIEAVLLFLPGVVALVGGIIIRNGFRKINVEPQFNQLSY
jgi:hypothetical protein